MVDLDVLVCGRGGGDGKVVCETLIDPPGGPEPASPPSRTPPEDDPNLPPESFLLPVEDVIGWVARHAAVISYDRDDSTKWIANPKSAAHPHLPLPRLHSPSQRCYPKPPRGLIIGLPSSLQSPGYLAQSARRTPVASCRFFPKSRPQPAGNGKPAVPESEPTSPKVSCLGRVIADGERKLCPKASRRATPPDLSRESSSVSTSASSEGLASFWASFLGLSCCGPRLLCEEAAVSSSRSTSPAASNGKIAQPAGGRGETGDVLLEPPAPGLDGMKRFTSGRRAASWGGDWELELEDVARSGASTQQRGERILPGRRSVGSLPDLDADRDWESSGSASV